MKYKEKNYKLIIDPKLLKKQISALYDIMGDITGEKGDQYIADAIDGVIELLASISDQTKEDK